MSLYKKKLFEHYQNPRNHGVIEGYNFKAELTNFSCGDSVLFQALVNNNYFEKIAFQGQGCIISQATASMLTEYIINKDFDFVKNLSKEDILNMIELDLGSMRLKCALLPLEALNIGINNLK